MVTQILEATHGKAQLDAVQHCFCGVLAGLFGRGSLCLGTDGSSVSGEVRLDYGGGGHAFYYLFFGFCFGYGSRRTHAGHHRP